MPSYIILTQSQVQASVDIDALLKNATDCLHFVTKFFGVISQSVPHIYHSALQLTPQSSIVRKQYGQKIYSPAARVLVGIPTLWDSCTASVGPLDGNPCAIWSPCGQLVAATFFTTIKVMDSITLETVSVLNPPSDRWLPKSLAFSPNGSLLACSYSG